VLLVDLVAELIREGRLALTRPVERVVTYHDACRLNKRKGIHEAPREVIRAIPGLTFSDVDHVTQWSYCSGAGAGLAIERPDLTAEISRRRVEQAGGLGVDTLVSACVWSERPLSEQGGRLDQPIEVMDLLELVAMACGLDGDGDGSEAVGLYASSMPAEQLERNGVSPADLQPAIEALGKGDPAGAIELTRPDIAERLSVAGTPEECVAKLRTEIVDAGVNHLIFAVTDAALVKALMGRDLDNVASVTDQLQLIHDEVMPAFA